MTEFNAHKFCREYFLFDAHSDIFWHVDEDAYDILKRNDTRHFDLPRAKEGGLDAVVMAACFDVKHTGDADPEAYAMRLIKLMDDTAARSNGKFIKITSRDEFESINPEPERLAFIVGIEGGAPFKGQIAGFERFYDAGMRLLGLTHNANNEISQGVDDEDGPYFISGFGWEVIAACEAKGVLVDAAHLNENNMKFLLDMCEKPFTVSHTACRALSGSPRNILDDHLFEMGRRGCVVGIDIIQPHLKSGDDAMDASIDDFLDHIEHAVEVAGIDAVGIGSDMDIIYPLPGGLVDASSYPAIAEGLHKRGWPAEDIAKTMGGNFRRLFLDILT